ncbi:histidinol-phosphate transaminase [Limisphaera ngatamarikiensis]|uniref:Histidinol-phosphate aminotransferase n=1 Tax=Limisphaera ngatamarikiensis TaxID=1324935 RepID=A0A6M1RZS2_9BACT|nr:histidinol-phosphate transaminase [Limisphaera ngatamarikiensis]NGO40252.1 histidinol-phosphate transaminase [Limisphaera ngatamarikiensis]
MNPSPIPLNPQLEQIPVYQPGRPIEEVARIHGLAPESIVKLASNENPLGPSPRALQALQAACATVHLYPDGHAFALKARLAEKLGLTPEHLILGNGSNEVLELVGHALLRPGVDVVVSQYCFAVYPLVTRLFGARLITVPARNFAHDLAAMRAAFTPQTRVVFIANPNNPTGTCAPPQELRQFVESVPPDVLIVLDEAYIEFLDHPADFLPAIREGRSPNLLLVRTFSKIYGLAGLRVGYGIGHPQVVAALEKTREPFNVNRLAQAAALAALDDHDHVEQTRAINKAGLRQLATGFESLGLPYIPSEANFILVRVGNAHAVFESMLRQGVIVRPMDGYDLPEWIRISVGRPEENERCLRALQLALNR